VDRSGLVGGPVEAARALLGRSIVRDDAAGRRVGRIVEVEAYGGPDDRASHARFGRTSRNAVMFGPPGFAYVYLVYGMYDCLNVVTGPEGTPAAVLIRAIEPLEGIDAMRIDRVRLAAARRHAPRTSPPRVERLVDARIASGPGLVGAALGLDRSWTGIDLCDPRSPLRLEDPAGTVAGGRVIATPRIGIDYAGDPWSGVPWRLAIGGHPSVSGPRSTR